MLTIRKSHVIVAAVCVAIAVAWWFIFNAIVYAPAKALDTAKGEFTVTVCGYSESYGQYGSSAEVILKREGVSISGRLIFYNDYIEVKPGDIVSVTANAHLGNAKNGEFIRLYAYSVPQITESDRLNIFFLPRIIAHKLTELAERIFPADIAPLMKAILLGNRTEWFSDAYKSGSFQRAGLSHVVAVSGMHLAYLVGLLNILLSKGRLRTIIGIPVILLFVLVTGATPSVVRAGVMAIVFLISQSLDRQYAPWRAMLISLGVLFLFNPFAVLSTSAILSYSSVAGIFIFEKRLKIRVNHKWLRPLAEMTGVALAANIFTFPLSAIFFGQVSLIFLPVNLLVLWAVAVTFISGIITMTLGCLWATLGSLFAHIPATFGRYIEFVALRLGNLPFASLSMDSVYASAWVVYITLTAWILIAAKSLRKRMITFSACFIVSLAIVQIFIHFDRPATLSAAALDVGQGQSIVVSSSGFSMLIDCGGNSIYNEGDIAANYLASNGIYKLDVLALTHFHSDHADGAAELLRRIKVQRLIVPLLTGDESGDIAAEIILAAETQGTEIQYVTELETLEFEDTTLTIYPPLGGVGANERGLMFLIEAGEFKAFISGDADTESELRLTEFAELPQVNVLFVGHHGSKSSSSERFLNILHPQTAIISVGENNSYRLPDEEVISRLASIGAIIYRTDENGTVVVEY